MTTSNPKFLIVDDEPMVVEVVVRCVSPGALNIRKAYDGEEAIAIAREFRPDCVITGVIMPGMSGFQEAIEILKFLPTCKFVFMSGSAHEPTIRSEYEQFSANASALLPKPFSRLELLNALAAAGISPGC